MTNLIYLQYSILCIAIGILFLILGCHPRPHHPKESTVQEQTSKLPSIRIIAETFLHQWSRRLEMASSHTGGVLVIDLGEGHSDDRLSLSSEARNSIQQSLAEIASLRDRSFVFLVNARATFKSTEILNLIETLPKNEREKLTVFGVVSDTEFSPILADVYQRSLHVPGLKYLSVSTRKNAPLSALEDFVAKLILTATTKAPTVSKVRYVSVDAGPVDIARLWAMEWLEVLLENQRFRLDAASKFSVTAVDTHHEFAETEPQSNGYSSDAVFSELRSVRTQAAQMELIHAVRALDRSLGLMDVYSVVTSQSTYLRRLTSDARNPIQSLLELVGNIASVDAKKMASNFAPMQVRRIRDLVIKINFIVTRELGRQATSLDASGVNEIHQRLRQLVDSADHFLKVRYGLPSQQRLSLEEWIRLKETAVLDMTHRFMLSAAESPETLSQLQEFSPRKHVYLREFSAYSIRGDQDPKRWVFAPLKGTTSAPAIIRQITTRAVEFSKLKASSGRSPRG